MLMRNGSQYQLNCKSGLGNLPLDQLAQLCSSTKPFYFIVTFTREHSKSRICIIGGGVSGLTATYELEALGHKVTLLEKSKKIGGKSGSVEVNGQHYDLGGHFLSDFCINVKDLVTKFNIETESATRSYIFDKNKKATVPPTVDPFQYQHEYAKFQTVKDQLFPSIEGATMFMYGKTLSLAAKDWFTKNNFTSISTLLSEPYTSNLYICININGFQVLATVITQIKIWQHFML